MKKHKAPTFPKISADQIAKNLKRSLGEVKAAKIASNLSKNLSQIGAEDFNHDFFNLKEIRKNERVWTQVHNILQKESK